MGDYNSPGTHWPGKATLCQQPGALGELLSRAARWANKSDDHADLILINKGKLLGV